MDKFFNLKTAVAALSILLVAAILLGLMGYLSLRRQLGPGGTPPVTSAPGNSTPGEDSVATKGSYTLSLKDYGAKGDGKTDDTQAIKSWLAALKPGYTGYIPAGEYVFKEPLVGPQVKGVGIRGEGAQQSILVYQGDDRDCDLLTLGSDSKLTALTGWILQGFSVESDVRMIGGTALRLRWMQGGTRIMDVDISRLNKEKNLWDGVWFDCCNVATYDGFNINVRNEGVIVSGADDSDAASDVSLDHGAITFCTVGIHVGGGFVCGPGAGVRCGADRLSVGQRPGQSGQPGDHSDLRMCAGRGPFLWGTCQRSPLRPGHFPNRRLFLRRRLD